MVLATSLKQKTVDRLPSVSIRPAQVLPASATEVLFTITGGVVNMLSLIGVVEDVAMDATNVTPQLIFNPTIGASINISTTTIDFVSDPLGTMYGLAGAIPSNWNADGTATEGMLVGPGYYLNTGTLDLLTAATNLGQVRWLCTWIPVDPSAVIRATPS